MTCGWRIANNDKAIGVYVGPCLDCDPACTFIVVYVAGEFKTVDDTFVGTMS